MRVIAAAFIGGVMLFQQASMLPPVAWLLGGIAVLLLAARLAVPVPFLAIFAGGLWAAGYALATAPAAIPEFDFRKNYLAEGEIVSLPIEHASRSRFIFRIHSLTADNKVFRGQWRVRLNWREAIDLKVGQRWSLQLKLKPVHGFRNPGSWDYSAWLYRQGIRYTGYVRSGEANGSAACCWLEQGRQWLRSQVNASIAESDGRAMFLALTLGDRSGIDKALRQVFAQTGTSHLMAISGLHIGLAALAFGAVAGFFWRRAPRLCAVVPALQAAAVAGLLTATLYLLFSGLGLPAQRAWLMLAIAVWALWGRQGRPPFDLLLLALLLIVLVDPMAVLQSGFWLSAVAVAAIFLVLPWVSERPVWQQALIVQLAISLALYPVLLIFDMSASAISPLVNLLAVPLFGFVLVPLSLLTMLGMAMDLPVVALLSLVVQLLDWAADMLAYLASISTSVSVFPKVMGPLGMGLLSLGVLLMLSPPGVPLRLSGLLLMLLAHWLPAQLPGDLEHGEFELTLLDVGQGLSAIVRTPTSTLVYDTGAAYPSGFNMADAVLLPYLRHHGVRSIDTLVISHGDNDHAGAASQLLRGIAARQLIMGEPSRSKIDLQQIGVDASVCRAGQQWTVDGVRFTFLHPSVPGQYKGNDASCVLMVRGSGGSVLLTGDIETKVENRLVAGGAIPAALDVVVAGHHGSKTSSSDPFVKHTAPDLVLYASGAYNRYGFPKAQVVERWASVGAEQFSTASEGAMKLTFRRQGVSPVEHWHRDNTRYWHLSPLWD